MTWGELAGPGLRVEAVVAAAALGLALLDALFWPRRPSRAGAWAALCALLAAVALGLQATGAGEADATPGSWLRADAGTAFADLLVLSGAVLAALLAVGTPASARRAGGPILLLLTTLGALVAVGAADVVTLFAGLELSALGLLAYQALDESPGERGGARAALRWAAPAGLATTLTALGGACLWSAAGSPRLDDVPAGGALAAAGGALLLTGLAVRAGVVPFHGWLAEVAVGSAPSAALLTVSAGVLPGLLVLGRLAGGILDAVVPDLPTLLMGLAVCSATLGGLLVVPERRLRRVVGYAVLSHVGFVLAGVATHAGEAPFSGTMWLQLAALVPAVAGCLAVAGLAGAGLGATASGLARQRPLQGAALCLFLVALAGLPPTLTFAGRSALFLSLADQGWALALGADALLLAYGLLRFGARVLFDDPATSSVPPASAGTVAAAVLSAVVLLVFGLWPLPLGRAASLASGGAG